MGKRLDVLLCDMGLVRSRSKAKDLIKMGYVLVNGKVAGKAGVFVSEADKVEIKEHGLTYVSRAGVKLEYALDIFGVGVEGLVCLDVGSSTGGFTECLLRKGAKVVYAVDVGKDQMDRKLKGDKRVCLFEGMDIRKFQPDLLFDFASIDVSFISLKIVLPYIYNLLKDGASVIGLVKPQFEVGPHGTKRGVVKEKSSIVRAVEGVMEVTREIGFEVIGYVESPILGKEGNREYLLCLKMPSGMK